MNTVKRKFTTNSRLLSELLTRYKNTFYAFCELINNSIQAKATEIKIEIHYPEENELVTSPIKSISVIDNGHGVPINEFENKILEIGTTAKVEGQGIGRFGALQIGAKVIIDTVAWDDSIKKYTHVTLPIDTERFKNKGLKEIDFPMTETIFEERKIPFYSATIENIHHGRQDKVAKKNRIVSELLKDNIRLALFEKYPIEVFNGTVSFFVNGRVLKKEEFIYDKPKSKKKIYTDTKGTENGVNFYFYNVKLQIPKVKVFIQIENSGIKSVAHEFAYSSAWHTPDMGAWFIYVDSPIFNYDLFRNIDFEEMGDEELTKLKLFIKETINDFFLKNNKRFEKFNHKLREDKYNPFKDDSPASETQEALFQKVAFIVEDQYKLLEKDNKIRALIYPLIDKALSNGYVKEIFDQILNLQDDSIEKFHDLLQKTDLENVVQFSYNVASKTEFLDFLHELIYGNVAEVLKERSQLHKIIENQLWLFGEAYNGTLKLWSDKKIGNILEEIRSSTMLYEPTEEDENLVILDNNGQNDITDLFFTNEKITDDGSKEYMVVELKSPKCLIAQKEINQIDKYAFTIEKHGGLPSDKVKYKLMLISSKLNDYAKSKMGAAYEIHRIPFLYEKKQMKNIEIYITTWAELIENNRRKLGYLSEQLKVKDKSVKDKFEEEYASLINTRVRSVLKRVI